MQDLEQSAKQERVRHLLLSNRQEHPSGFWGWMSDLDGRPADKKSANKFLLACVLDYQMPYQRVWANAKKFAEDELGDPNDLWLAIMTIPKSELHTKYRWLHRFPQGRDRIQRIGSEIVRSYAGDARKIWEGQTTVTALKRLERMRVGPEISRVTVGGLIDTKQIAGNGELKADIHTTRVLGRVFKGSKVSASQAHYIAETVLPGHTWHLDFPLFQLGLRICKARDPHCGDCYLRRECEFASAQHAISADAE